MFQIVANQMVIMFILIMVGYMIRKVKLIDHNGSKTLSNILLLLVNPVVILNSFLTVEYDAAMVRNFLWTILFALISHILGIAASKIMLPGKDPDTMIEHYSAVYSNCGFMGIPLVQSILGAKGVFYLTAYLVVFNFLTWTHGLVIITGDTSPKQLARGLRSPVMFTMLAGIICYFLRLKVPGNVETAFTYIAGMNTPLGMFVAGAGKVLVDADYSQIELRLLAHISDDKTMQEYRTKLENDFSFMSYVPFVFISAKTGQRINKLYELIKYVYEQNSMRISTGMLNDVLAYATTRVQPPSDKGRRLKIYYMTQPSTKPPTFVTFVNRADLFHFSYRRYIENQIRSTFGLEGTPVRFIVRERGGNDK